MFSIAYAAGGNQGQGNPNVGAVQSGVWKLTNSDAPLWAEQYINSENDEYRLRNATGELTGEVVRFSDLSGVLKGTPDVESTGRGGTEATGSLLKDSEGNILTGDALTGGLLSTGSWGGNARAGIVAGQPTYDTSGAIDWQSYGDDPGWETYFDTDPALGPARVQDPRAGAPQYTGTPTYSPSQRGAGGPAGETDFLAYRPGSEAYWQSYLGPELTGSLMRMKQPAITPAALGYLPGEQRDPTAWANFLGYDGKLDKQFQGAIPQGIWTPDPQGYTGLTKARGGMAGYQGAPWRFAAQPSQMIAQPAWTPYDISPQAAGQWTGLLGDWAAPALNTTNLLGVA